MEKLGTSKSAAAPRKPKPETWDKNLGFASEYMKAARQNHNSHHDEDTDSEPGSPKRSKRTTNQEILHVPDVPVPEVRAPEVPDERRLPFNVTSVETVSAALKITQGVLHYYKNLGDVDTNVKSMYDVAGRLDSILRYLRPRLARNLREVDPTYGQSILDLQSCKRRLAETLRRLFKGSPAVSQKRKSRPASVTYSIGTNGERRASWTCSFREHTNMKLMNSIRELRELIDPILDDLHFDLDDSGLVYPSSSRRKSNQSEPASDIFRSRSPQVFGPSKLCEDCSRIFQLRESWPINLRRHEFQPKIIFSTSVKKLYDATKAGCRFCKILHSKIIESPEYDIWKIARAEVNWWKYWVDDRTNSMDDSDDEESYSLKKDFGLRFLVPNAKPYAEEFFVTKSITGGEANRAIAASTNSKESLTVARSWIRNCSRNHTQCNRTLKNIRRPSRLIFLGADDRAGARVMEHRETPSEVKYMTMSHRWSHDHMIRLTTTNYAEFTQKIDTKLLPKSFLEAIEVTRRLGVFYLWIDSLCILQDSVADWNRESSRMSDIYTGSYCNIAATCATDSTVGLYAERDPLEIRGCIVKDPNTSAIFKVETDFYGSREWEAAISTSPLLARGWVLQECTLAPRTLHFGRDRLFWQCSTQKASEDSPAELRVNRMRYYQDVPPEDEDDDKEFHGPAGWANIVHQYSRCELTFPAKDKLVAISGIAKNYDTGENYLAGLWKENLIPQLTWRVFGGNERPQEYQAPSWSWASVNREFKYSWRDGKLTRLQLVASLLGTDITPVTQDRFGKVSKGQLRIQGSLVKLMYRGHTARNHVLLEWGTLRRTWKKLHSDSEFSMLPSNRPISVDIDFVDELERGEILYCMPLYYERDMSFSTQGTVHGIVLALTGKSRGEYERRGTIFLGDKSMGGAWIVDQFTQCCREGAKEISRKCYESRDGRKHGMPMYTITVV